MSNKKLTKNIVFTAFASLLCGVMFYLYLYQDHKIIGKIDAVGVFSSQELIDVFQDSDLENDKTILDQVIEVSGISTDMSENSITLDHKVFIKLSDSIPLELNKSYTIKGNCLGYDDLLEEVKIDQAIFLNSQ